MQQRACACPRWTGRQQTGRLVSMQRSLDASSAAAQLAARAETPRSPWLPGAAALSGSRAGGRDNQITERARLLGFCPNGMNASDA